MDYNKHKIKKLRPDLTNNSIDEFTHIINESIQNEKYVIIHEIENESVEGKIIRIDQKLRRLLVKNESWYIPLKDISNLELK